MPDLCPHFAGEMGSNRNEQCNSCIELDALVAGPTIMDENETRSLRASLNDSHDPLHRIPPEIVSRIFEVFCEEELLGAKGAPFVLCAVCHLWREIAQATPKIWCIVRAILNPEAEDMIFMELFKEYVDRSGSLGIGIHLTWRGNKVIEFRHPSYLPTVLEIIRSCASRWKSLELELPLRALQSLFHHLPVSRPTLRHLTLYPTPLYDDDTNDENETERSLNLTSISGNLETFELTPSEDYNPIVLEEVQVIYSNLTQVVGPGTDVLLSKILRSSPHLKIAKLDTLLSGQTEEDLLSLLGEPFTHHTLRHLEFTSLSEQVDPFDHFLTQFTFPNLESLRIEACFTPDGLQPEVVVPFLKRSGQVLRELYFAYISWTVEELKQVLATLPNLEELSFGYTRQTSTAQLLDAAFGNEIAELASGPESDTTPSRLPKLTFLKLLSGSWEPGDTWDNLYLVETHVTQNNLLHPTSQQDVHRAPLFGIELMVDTDTILPYMHFYHLETILKLREMGAHMVFETRTSSAEVDLVQASGNILASRLEQTSLEEV